MEKAMKKIALALAVCLISSAPAFATCKSDAADKKLAGAALKSFMTKCERDAKTTCEADSKQKNLAGAAKTSHMKKCVGNAVDTQAMRAARGAQRGGFAPALCRAASAGVDSMRRASAQQRGLSANSSAPRSCDP